MTKRVFLMLLLLLCVGAANATEPTAAHLHSVVLNEDREYQVALPQSYEWAKDGRYPVLGKR